jgi:hypothetical protein
MRLLTTLVQLFLLFSVIKIGKLFIEDIKENGLN